MITNHKIVEDFFNTPVPLDIEKFVSMNFAITEEIILEMRARGWKSKDLAHALGKKESEISKWLTGAHNLTLMTLAKISAIFDKDFIMTPKQAEEKFQKVKFVPVGIYMNKEKIKNYNFSPNAYSTKLKKVS